MSQISDELKNRSLSVFDRLVEAFPNAKLTLNFKNAFELLVATVLAARTPDKRVNEVTPELFKKFPDAKSMAQATVEEIQSLIQKINMSKTKAERLKKLSQQLVEKHGGEVPSTIEELTALPGVGRKTANVVLGNAMGIVEGLEVDSHIARVSYRLGLTKHTNPDKVEQDLMQVLPKEVWVKYTHVAKELGRKYCRPKNPKCSECPVNDLCPKIGVK
ncbi:MAG: endonuclease III [Chlorobi bacterium]|nr:endonuclease III [Chlorobiota bacterium]